MSPAGRNTVLQTTEDALAQVNRLFSEFGFTLNNDASATPSSTHSAEGAHVRCSPLSKDLWVAELRFLSFVRCGSEVCSCAEGTHLHQSMVCACHFDCVLCWLISCGKH